MSDPTHGTLGAYLAGCRCEPCSENWNEYQRKHRRTPKGKATMARIGSVHGRAKTILKQRHKAEFDQIVADLRAEDQARLTADQSGRTTQVEP